MANIYVRSTDGNNTDNGSTWALAKATLAGAGAIDLAGDRIYVSQAHVESSGATQTCTIAGTPQNPVWIIGSDDAAEPPTAVSAAPTIDVTGAFDFTLTSSGVYIYGLTITGARNVSLGGSSSAANIFLDNCDVISTSSTTGSVTLGSTSTSSTGILKLKNCGLKIGNVGSSIYVYGDVYIEGGEAISGGSTSNSGFFAPLSNSVDTRLFVSGFDFSTQSTSMILFSFGSASQCIATFRNCKLPASWTGTLVDQAPTRYGRVEMYNCDSTDTNYRMWIEEFSGSIKSETTIVRTGGANDGTTPLSWKMASNADSGRTITPLRSPEIAQWIDTTGSPITVAVEMVTDNVTLDDAECWLEVQYLGTSGFPRSTFINDFAADILATPAAQASSSETWTTTGLTTPVKQKMSVTFTPQEKGYMHAVVRLAKPSTTVYVDPKLMVT
jgi:hypothetical protein